MQRGGDPNEKKTKKEEEKAEPNKVDGSVGDKTVNP